MLLLSHYPGRAITNFYYDTTVDATRPIESLSQKAWLIAGANQSEIKTDTWRNLQTALLKNGIFLVPDSYSENEKRYDFRLITCGNTLCVKSTKTNRQIAMSTVLTRSGELFFQENTMEYGLRFFLALSLGIMCPAFFLVLTAGLISSLWHLVVTGSHFFRKKGVAAIAVLLVFLAIYLGPGKPLGSSEEKLVKTAREGGFFERARAARKLFDSGGINVSFDDIIRMSNSEDARVRYWAARGLALHRGQETVSRLLRLSDESSVTVVTASIHALSFQSGTMITDRLADMCVHHPRLYIRYKAFFALKRKKEIKKKNV